jgi:hypothetical protein
LRRGFFFIPSHNPDPLRRCCCHLAQLPLRERLRRRTWAEPVCPAFTEKMQGDTLRLLCAAPSPGSVTRPGILREEQPLPKTSGAPRLAVPKRPPDAASQGPPGAPGRNARSHRGGRRAGARGASDRIAASRRFPRFGLEDLKRHEAIGGMAEMSSERVCEFCGGPIKSAPARLARFCRSRCRRRSWIRSRAQDRRAKWTLRTTGAPGSSTH